MTPRLISVKAEFRAAPQEGKASWFPLPMLRRTRRRAGGLQNAPADERGRGEATHRGAVGPEPGSRDV